MNKHQKHTLAEKAEHPSGRDVSRQEILTAIHAVNGPGLVVLKLKPDTAMEIAKLCAYAARHGNFKSEHKMWARALGETLVGRETLSAIVRAYIFGKEVGQ